MGDDAHSRQLGDGRRKPDINAPGTNGNGFCHDAGAFAAGDLILPNFVVILSKGDTYSLL
jgi:hypothetical protein